MRPNPIFDRSSRFAFLRVTVLAAASALVLAACQPAVTPASAASEANADAPPAVPVMAVLESSLEHALTQIGRVEAAQRVELRPRVAGHVDAVLFREGDLVTAGQPLFRIDPRPFEAAVARAEAELKLAQAREALAHAEAERAIELAREAAIATEQLEQRKAAYAEARARRAAAQAALQTAKLDSEFALIRAPIDGRIGRALVTAGNYVAAGASQPPLATIVSVAPLHVHFQLVGNDAAERVARAETHRKWQALILDADGKRELARAPVDFADNEITATTGTLRLRARVDKPDSRLLPGQFVRVQLTTGATEPTLMVPEKAIGTDQGRRYVLVVGADSKVEYRPVEVGPAHGEHRIVSAGLAAGEQVIVSGLMRVRPGMTVQARPEAEAPALAGAGKPEHS
jgi:multidrug efflux system membrane fusion protein